MLDYQLSSFHNAGFNVVGVDASGNVIDSLKNGFSTRRSWNENPTVKWEVTSGSFLKIVI